MRKDIFLPALALVGGAAGFALRCWQLATALDEQTMLFRSGAPATLALIALCAALAAAFALLCRGGAAPQDYTQAFYCPSSGYMTVMTAGGFLLLAAAALGLWEAMSQYQLWNAGLNPTPPVMMLLTAVLAVPAGAAALLLGRGNYRVALPKNHPLLAALPAYMLLGWIVTLYQDNSRQPEHLLFAFTLLGVICAELGFYTAACFAFGRPRPKACLFFSMTGVVLLLTALADRPSFFYAVLSAGCVLLLLAQSYALLRSMFGPFWPKRLLNQKKPPVQSSPEDTQPDQA